MRHLYPAVGFLDPEAMGLLERRRSLTQSETSESDGDGVRDSGFEGLLEWEESDEYLPGTLGKYVAEAVERAKRKWNVRVDADGTRRACGGSVAEKAIREELVAKAAAKYGPRHAFTSEEASALRRAIVSRGASRRRRSPEGVGGGRNRNGRGERRALMRSELAALAELGEAADGRVGKRMTAATPEVVEIREEALWLADISLVDAMRTRTRRKGEFSNKRRKVYERMRQRGCSVYQIGCSLGVAASSVMCGLKVAKATPPAA